MTPRASFDQTLQLRRIDLIVAGFVRDLLFGGRLGGSACFCLRRCLQGVDFKPLLVLTLATALKVALQVEKEAFGNSVLLKLV